MPTVVIAAGGTAGHNPVRATAAVIRAAGVLPAARAFLRRVGADVVLGGGGYVAGPVGLAAAITRTPLVLTEADSRLGLANLLLARWARRICLAFPIEGREGPKYLVTGRPVPRAILAADRRQARDRLGLGDRRPCVVVFGGSLGARSLNLAAVEAFAGSEDLAVIHISGRRDFAEVASALGERAGSPGYRLLDYVDTLAEPL